MRDSGTEGLYRELEGKRSTIIDRVERYAGWTLPSIFPLRGNDESTELQNDVQSFGAQAVNHLSNKLMIGLFGPSRPFFRLDMTEEMQVDLAKLNISEDEAAVALNNAERECVKELDRMGAREPFTMLLQNLIIGGNALLYFPDEGELQVYNLRSFVVRRDMTGFPIEIIAQDEKKFHALPEDVQFNILASSGTVRKDPDSMVSLYTHVHWDTNMQKYLVTQSADNVELTGSVGIYTKDNCPFIPLVWKLVRGEDYGRGLVEDYSGDFHSLSNCELSMAEVIGIMSQIRPLVNPTGVTDFSEIIAAPNGQAVSGRLEDVQFLQAAELNNTLASLQSYATKKEQRLSKAFLMDSAGIREAERVTAEEIRLVARDLEMALGGVYTRLAQIFQLPVARLLLARINFKLGSDKVEPIITTGLDALSRSGDLESYRLFIQDVQLLDAIGPDTRARLDEQALINFIAVNNNLNIEIALKSEDQQVEDQQQVAAAEGQAHSDEMALATAPVIAQQGQ